MFIYAIGSKRKKTKKYMSAMRDPTSVIGRTSPGCSLEFLAEESHGPIRMKDRLFAAKRMPILAIVNFISGGQERRFPHALGWPIHEVPSRITVCYIRGRPSKVRTSLRVSERCLFGTGPFHWAVLSCPFYDLFSISEAAGALIRVSLRELPHQYSSSSHSYTQSLTTVVCTSDTSAL